MRTAEARSLAYHRAVAERLRREPGLLVGVRVKIERWIAEQGRSLPYAEEWLRIVDAGVEAVLSVLEDASSERAADLRHASPFAGLISAKERWAIWRTTKNDARPT